MQLYRPVFSSNTLRSTSLKLRPSEPAQTIISSRSTIDTIIGETIIGKRKKESIVPVKIFIVQSINPCDYYLIDSKNNKLGSTTLHIYSPRENKTYGVEYKYKKFPGAVYVDEMESLYDDYIGVGNALHELAVMVAQRAGYQGRVFLDAEKSSQIFHYKLGFRAMGENHYLKDEAIENEIEKAEKKIRRGIISSTKEHDTSRLGPIPMYLPEEAIQEVLKSKTIVFHDTTHQ